MDQKQSGLIAEEQRKLDTLIKRMDSQLLAYDKRLTEALLKMKKNKGWKDAYGAFLDAKYDRIKTKEQISELIKSRDALYTMRIELECEDLDGDSGKTDIEDLKIGLHTYAHNGELFIVSWKMPVCRHFMFNDNAEEYVGSVYQHRLDEQYKTHYRLQMKRRIDLEFDEVVDVTQIFPLSEEEEQIVVDRFLQDLLKRRGEQEFKNIVFSIQKRQGEIIQVPYDQNLIVQGCAGSGKSMIMLHRLPILLEDNQVALSKNNIYVITPSETYIQMMAGLREDLELEDLRMGTIEDYYRYSIERYGKQAADCGRINPLLKLSDDKLEFVYSSSQLEKSIKWRLDSAVHARRIDKAEGRRVLGVKERNRSSDNYRDMIQGEILSVQDLISENEHALREYSGAYTQVIKNLQDLEQTLRTRRLAEERRLNREIEQLRNDIWTHENEIAGLNKMTNYRAIKNRHLLINEAEKAIQDKQQELEHLSENHFYTDLEHFASNIEKYRNSLVIGDDPDNHRERYKSRKRYQKAKDEYLEGLYKGLSRRTEIYDVVSSMQIQLNDLANSDSAVELSWVGQVKLVLDAAEDFAAMKRPYLHKDYFDELKRASEYFTMLLDHAEVTTYTGIMNLLGYKEDERERFFVPTCAPFIFLKVLAVFNGPLGNNRESLIAIDEAQNYTAEELKLLKEINGGKVVFNLFGDIKQHIEGEKGISNWSDISDIGDFKTYNLRENYRNALQITNECNRRFIMDMEPINVDGTGVKELEHETEFRTFATNRLSSDNRTGLSCLIFKNRSEVRLFLKELSNECFRIHDMTEGEKELSQSLWNVMTVDQVKGLEFSSVIAVTGRMTDNEKYLTFTRALDELIIFDKEYGNIELLTNVSEEAEASNRGNASDEINANGKSTDIKSEGTEGSKRGRRKEERKSNTQKKEQSKLVAFFKDKGLEVIDNRQSGGFLWVIGSRDQIMFDVRECCRKYRVTGQFGKSQETGGRESWYTKSER